MVLSYPFRVPLYLFCPLSGWQLGHAGQHRQESQRSKAQISFTSHSQSHINWVSTNSGKKAFASPALLTSVPAVSTCSLQCSYHHKWLKGSPKGDCEERAYGTLLCHHWSLTLMLYWTTSPAPKPKCLMPKITIRALTPHTKGGTGGGSPPGNAIGIRHWVCTMAWSRYLDDNFYPSRTVVYRSCLEHGDGITTAPSPEAISPAAEAACTHMGGLVLFSVMQVEIFTSVLLLCCLSCLTNQSDNYLQTSIKISCPNAVKLCITRL